MARRAREDGFTLLEVMVAMGVLVVGSLGVLSIQALGSRMNGDARVMTEATAIGQDILSQVRSWKYEGDPDKDDPRLSNTNTSNDALFADPQQVFERALSSIPTTAYDLDETAITTVGPSWTGIPTETIQRNGFRRFVNVAYLRDPPTNAVLGLEIAAIVRWERSGAARRIVLITVLRNPGVTLD